MANANSIEALKGTWDYVDSDPMDEYLKELGVGMMGRMMAKGMKPRLVISENNGKWNLRTETTFKTMSIEFIPNIEFEETTADGREVKGVVKFENEKWIQKMCDKNGKESMITRWIDENDRQQIILECGQAKVHRVYKRLTPSTMTTVEALIGTWDYVDGDSMDEYLREVGLSFLERMMARGVRPRLVILENDGKWAIRIETMFRVVQADFEPEIEFEETTVDGRRLRGTVRFEDGKWQQKMIDINRNQELRITRWVNESDQQQIIIECGQIKVHSVYKRV